MGLWEYKHRTDEIRYGSELTYRKAAEFLDGCGPVVEDWGCGGAYARKFFMKSRYVGLDGSEGRADRIVDLRDWTSAADGIMIRHILEHNYDWPLIVAGAIRSFQKKLVIVFFMEPQRFTRNAFNQPNGVPNLVIGTDLLMSHFPKDRFVTRWEEVEDKDTSPNGKEWILYVERVE